MDIVFSQYPRFFVAKARQTRLEINNITGKKMGIVKTENLTFEYIRRDEEGNVDGITTAVDNVNMELKQGEFIAIL